MSNELIKLKEYASQLWDEPTVYDPGAVINKLLTMIDKIPDAASQCGGRWVNPLEIDLTLKTGEYFGKYNDVEKCFVVVQGGEVVSLKFSNGARITNEWRDMKKLNILMYDETRAPCPHEQEVKSWKESKESWEYIAEERQKEIEKLKERIFLLETQLNHSQNDSPF